MNEEQMLERLESLQECLGKAEEHFEILRELDRLQKLIAGMEDAIAVDESYRRQTADY